ncbi:hypothetical protein TNCV_4937891 [Trichonephila clavipes]|nr:hypothetical protein TNCV_4937891 [Trichonephila clavipes]
MRSAHECPLGHSLMADGAKFTLLPTITPSTNHACTLLSHITVRRVWRRPRQRVNPAITIARHTVPQPRVMVRGAISFDERTLWSSLDVQLQPRCTLTTFCFATVPFAVPLPFFSARLFCGYRLMLLLLMSPDRQCEVEVHEIHRDKGLDLDVKLCVALSTMQLTKSTGEDVNEVQLITADLIREGLMFARKISTRVKQDVSSTWREALVHEWYEGNHLVVTLLGTGSWRDETTLAKGYAVDILELKDMLGFLRFPLLVRIAKGPKPLMPQPWLVFLSVKNVWVYGIDLDVSVDQVE